MDQLLQLFLIFLKVNLLSTSGPASVGLLYHEVAGKLVTENQFIQAVGLSSVLPGSDALQLAIWGFVVVGGIDNLVYPILVGNRLRLHTVPALISIIGGVAVFGPSGLIIGPLAVAITASLLETWRTRTNEWRIADDPLRP